MLSRVSVVVFTQVVMICELLSCPDNKVVPAQLFRLPCCLSAGFLLSMTEDGANGRTISHLLSLSTKIIYCSLLFLLNLNSFHIFHSHERSFTRLRAGTEGEGKEQVGGLHIQYFILPYWIRSNSFKNKLLQYLDLTAIFLSHPQVILKSSSSHLIQSDPI